MKSLSIQPSLYSLSNRCNWNHSKYKIAQHVTVLYRFGVRIFLLSALCTFCIHTLIAQEKKPLHPLPDIYFGPAFSIVPTGNNLFTSNSKSFSLLSKGEVLDRTPQGIQVTYLQAGATHFNGLLNTYLAIPLYSANLIPRPFEIFTDRKIKYGAMAGIRVFPGRLQENSLRFYFGAALFPVNVIQEDYMVKSSVTSLHGNIDVGVVLKRNLFYYFFNISSLTNSETNVPTSRTATEKLNLPTYSMQFGIYFRPGQTRLFNKSLDAQLPAKKLPVPRKGLFIAAGISQAFVTRSSSYIKGDKPYLDDYKTSRIYPEISLGYHFPKLDMIVQLSQRCYQQDRSAFNYENQISRLSRSLDVLKYIGTFGGLSPYLGAGISLEKIRVREYESDIPVALQPIPSKVTPVFYGGWDLRPGGKNNWWSLRSNIRYTPWLDVQIHEKKMSLQHAEITFLQLLYYPQQHWANRKQTKNRKI